MNFLNRRKKETEKWKVADGVKLMILSAFGKLDETLRFLSEFDESISFNKIIDNIELEGFNITNQEAFLILNKLEKDGFVDSKEIITNEINYGWFYIITFEGKLFVQQGGYKQKKINENAENIRLAKLEQNQKDYQNRIFWLTAILAFGTMIAAVYYAIEILRYFQLMH